MSKPRTDLSERDIAVAGVGLTPVGEHWNRSLRELALEAIDAALEDAVGLRPQAVFVANMLAPSLSGQSQLGALLTDFAGMRGVESSVVEAAGASGGMALRQAYLAILSGEIDTALVIGVEKITDKVGPAVDTALASATDVDYEAVQGVTPTAQAALVMRRYLHEHGAPPNALAGFSLTAHANAASNPNAMYPKAIGEEAYAKAGRVSDPVGVFDVAPMADGAAAILLVRRQLLPDRPDRPMVVIRGSGAATSAMALHDEPDPLSLPAAADSAQAAYGQAGLQPDDVDVFELHDLYSIYAALALEASGFAPRGKGWRLAQNGAVSRQGSIPICTFGGSKARGDVGGATGVFQAAEVVLQLQGRAGPNQVPDARVGMSQCIGGSGATCATHIFVRLNGGHQRS